MTSISEKYDKQTILLDQIREEKVNLSRQMVSLRNRVSRMTTEKAEVTTKSDDVCRLLKRIKELESQLAMFHTAEKPTEELQVI